MAEVTVRPYEPRDRARVRHVCFATGYMGEPIDWQWRDAASFADLFSGYYTDAEPESAFVVEVDGVVAGYLLGCVDTSRAWSPARPLVRNTVRRGLPFRPGTAGVVWRGLWDGVTDLARGRVKLSDVELDDPRWPAHFHIDLLPEARGHGAGVELVDRWLALLRGKGVPGCHLQTWAENASAIRFLSSRGFEPHGDPVPMPGVRSRTGARHHSLTMVQSLTS